MVSYTTDSPRQAPQGAARTTARRLSKDQRRGQLLETASAIVRSEGTDALTLSSLAAAAGVTKPIAYEHFGTRDGLLMALYRHYDSRQTEIVRAALSRDGRTLEETARILSSAFVDCVLEAGPAFDAVSAALSASPDMEAFRRAMHQSYVAQYRKALAPFVKLSDRNGAAVFTGLIGAAEALASAASDGRMTRDRAITTLTAMIVALLG